MRDNIKTVVIYICIFYILSISLAGCGKNNENEILKDKINSEISYLDTKLIDMLNNINGILIQNYIVKAEQVNEETGSSNTKSSNSSSGSKEQSSDTQQESSGGQNGSNTNEDSNSGGSQSSESSSNVKYRMESNEILSQQRISDWKTVKSEIEKLYSSWSTIILDLYKINVNNQEILSFNADLDIATQSIKNENKEASLKALAKLYSYIPKYIVYVSNDVTTTNIYQTKSSILNAYAIIEENNSTQIKNELSNAEQAFMPIINNINSKTNNQSNINRAYILIKELQNSVDNKDKDIFYIKYKNLIQELNDIK